MIYKCKQCKAVIESETEPSSRLCKPNIQIGPNSFKSGTVWIPAGNHYSTICCGPERGEDYYQHDWHLI